METENLLTDLNETARRAFYWISFDPDKRGQRTIDAYSEELSKDIARISEHAPSEEIAAAAIERYTAKYKQILASWLHSQSRTASSAITGGSNFPVARQQKLHRWADNKYEQFRELRERMLKAILKSFKPKVTPASELEEAKKNLAARELWQEKMKKANVIIKKGSGNILEKLIEIGLTEKSAIEVMSPTYYRSTAGFPSYSLTNNNAMIRTLRERVKMLESKAEKAATIGKNEVTIQGIRIVQNWEEDRLQLFFDGKPEEYIIKELRGSWKWSPRGLCWQRKNTNNAQWSLKQLLKLIESKKTDL